MEEDTIYMHADTLCAPEILETILHTDGDIVLPVEYKHCDEEAMKVVTENGRVTEISKLIPCEKAEGEFIGIAKLDKKVLSDLQRAAKKLMMQKAFSSYFEGVIQELINEGNNHIVATNIGECFWSEVDFLEDYQRATEQICENLVDIAKKWKKL